MSSEEVAITEPKKKSGNKAILLMIICTVLNILIAAHTVTDPIRPKLATVDGVEIPCYGRINLSPYQDPLVLECVEKQFTMFFPGTTHVVCQTDGCKTYNIYPVTIPPFPTPRPNPTSKDFLW